MIKSLFKIYLIKRHKPLQPSRILPKGSKVTNFNQKPTDIDKTLFIQTFLNYLNKFLYFWIMKKWWVILSVCMFFSCSSPTEKIPLSFYYWRTTFALSETEKDYLTELEVDKLYVRYFDVALKNNEPIPVTSVIFQEQTSGFEIVPVIYIKNEVFLQDTDTQDLAQKIIDYIQQINTMNNISINEIQFDCDWSLQSKDNFFQFIADVKKLHPKLSATIRLHQIKYADKTGIPDVQNGVLMYYNMGVISADDNNSIYERGIAQRYIKSLENYSLPLDIALPIFSWGVHIRDNQVVNLIGGMRQKDMATDKFKKLSAERYLVVDDFIYNGRYLAKNDVIKIEEPTTKQLKEMVKDLRKHVKNTPKEIILYDLNEQNLTEYERKVYQDIRLW